ncbi:cellulose synthase catalytic subunit (UDP-forming) [Rhizobium rhizosphaerae]|uniref:Cellulose synthase catalytic subunit [UDP-forming] n=1 Tax=Xaviernesmea rhizosphaerae TaxID=1672749 RepID=A0A1Q9AM28_9HYPH|nr:UDP-forming cellulose synthase catalytic subunit [Xaviernesmea rhizosphaerae]OLP56457.1 cellulose synthase catalytic subunit (UDP-forming) [Xaviernesmea rhizosphaerae]
MFRIVSLALWVLSSLALFIFVLQPVGADVQLVVAGLTIAFLFVITRFDGKGLLRYIALATASIIVLRYAYWRTTSTLPPIDDLLSFIPGMALYVSEMFCIVMFFISVFVVADPIERETPALPADEDLPTVDVFVPSYNESAEILSLTLSAAAAMDYPRDKFKVYLLDDGGTDQKRNSNDPETAAAAQRRGAELKALCADLGVHYLTRALNNHAKAGNLNAGLERTSGDLIAVFDADHAPERRFLRETVGFFGKDPDLFLVQTPHFFANPDPVERNLGTYATMPSENEMFYTMIQKGLDRWNASFFCGSAAVLRREALEEVGGFSGITITEDCETALELHSRGWNSVYVDKPLITGLQPESFTSFIGQRSRWCRGMIQILILKNPLFKQGLTLAQRISYLSSCLFWMFPFVRATFLVAPLLFILFNLKIFNASAEDFLAYTVTYLVASEILRNYLYGRMRWPWISELYEYVQSVFLVRAIVSVLLNPRKPTFNVTDKGMSLTQRQLSSLAWPFFAIFAGLSMVLAVAIYRYQTEPALGDLILITGAWNILNLVIAGAALGIVTEQPTDVEGISLPVARKAELDLGTQTLPVLVRQMSSNRVLIEVGKGSIPPLRPGDHGRLLLIDPPADVIIPSIPAFVGKPVNHDLRSYLIDLEPEAQHYAAVSTLLLSDLDLARQIRSDRQHRRNYILASLSLVRWAIVSPFAAVSALLSSRPEGGRISRRRRQVQADKATIATKAA